MDPKKIESVQTAAQELLEKLGITGDVSVVVDETNAFRVHIASEETGLLIGHHGRTLESLQIVMGSVIARKIGEWVKVYVNVGDYREKREETLMRMAQNAAERVLATGRPVDLPRLSASDRRVVHMTLSGDDRVETESVGEGMDRTLVVKLKQ